MAKTTYSREELERQLSESRREFWAADATINNLELKLADMEAQLANAEKRIAELESLTAPKLTQQEPVSVPEVVGWEDVPEEITEDDIALASAWAHGFNQCRAAMLQRSEPETDNTNQQFESLSRGDK